MKLRHSITVARPLPAVWAFMADIAATETLWQPDIRSVTFEGEPVLAPGAVFVEERRSLGRTVVWTFKVTDVRPLESYAIASIKGEPAYRGRRSFEAVSGGTRITEDGDVALPRLAELLSPLLRPLAQRRIGDAYARLKALLEARTD